MSTEAKKCWTRMGKACGRGRGSKRKPAGAVRSGSPEWIRQRRLRQPAVLSRHRPRGAQRRPDPRQKLPRPSTRPPAPPPWGVDSGEPGSGAEVWLWQATSTMPQ